MVVCSVGLLTLTREESRPVHEIQTSSPEREKDGEDRVTHTTPLQPSDSLRVSVDEFAHMTQPQGPSQPPGGPAEPLHVGLMRNLLPLEVFAPGTGT